MARVPRLKLRHKIFMVALSLTVAILLAELGLRCGGDDVTLGGAMKHWGLAGNADIARIFMVDPDFGFRPVLGSSAYDANGVLRNQYSPAKPPGITRLLFIGDSVTARGHLVRGLQKVYGERRFQYWNAGVESFNTVQEVRYYQRYNRRVRPDHVILSFHNNDFDTTPVALVNDEGDLLVYSPLKPTAQLSPWAFKHSYLYRYWVGVSARWGRSTDEIARETEESLVRLQRLLRAQKTRFSIVLLPILRPHDRWTTWERWSRQRFLAMMRRHPMRHFDLLDELHRALHEGVPCCEPKGDYWHPSAQLAQRFAEDLHRRGLLAEPGAASRQEGRGR